jgi:hypothetical protein
MSASLPTSDIRLIVVHVGFGPGRDSCTAAKSRGFDGSILAVPGLRHHLEKHPDKTFIGRIERGFDFLGYHFSRQGLAVAKQTIADFIEKASGLYEQKHSAALAATALEMYIRRWLRWANGGMVFPRAVAASTDGAGAFAAR